MRAGPDPSRESSPKNQDEVLAAKPAKPAKSCKARPIPARFTTPPSTREGTRLEMDLELCPSTRLSPSAA
ncbi:hypothetical protein Vi05172_g7371 [Venturia inaequalis]|nr:hypothetical protein Vi05172_g7371 [Venturia inaequalis]